MGNDDLKELGKDLSNEELGKVSGGRAVGLDAKADLAARCDEVDIPLSGRLGVKADDSLGIPLKPTSGGEITLGQDLPLSSNQDLGLGSRHD